MDYAKLKAEYDVSGYLIIRRFLVGEELQTLQRNIDRYIREIVPTLPAGDAFYENPVLPETLKQLNRMQQDTNFKDYTSHPLWKSTAEALLGEPAEAQGAEWFNKPPRTSHVTPPHQDNFYFCLTPSQVLTMWLALDNVDEENGCLRYVPGSHLRGIRPHSRTKTLGFSQGITDYDDQDRDQEVVVHAQPGDLLIHHGDMIHRAEANRSSIRHRRSFAMVFQGQSCSRDETAFQRYLQSAATQHQQMGVVKNHDEE